MSFIDGVLAKVFGTKTDREVKAMLPTVAAISALEPELRELSDIDLAAKTIEFKEMPTKARTARCAAAGLHGQSENSTVAESAHAGATDTAISARRRPLRHSRPARNGMVRKIQLARRSSGREKTTRAPSTQSPISMIVEASNGTESVSQGPPASGPESSGGAFKNRIAKAKPMPR